jgi:transposase InsO family protein
VLQDATADGQALEPQTCPSGIQGHEIESEAGCEAPLAQASARSAVPATSTGYRLVDRLHGRCAELRTRFRTLNVLDDFNREAVHIEVDTSITSRRLIRVFEQLLGMRGLPQVLRSDNGPEFLGEEFVQWLRDHGVAIQYIEPGEPNQNAYIERFNRTFREDILDQYLFLRLQDVREAAYWWMIEYNEERPHDSLRDLTPSDTVNNTPGVLLLNCLLDGGAYEASECMTSRIFIIVSGVPRIA